MSDPVAATHLVYIGVATVAYWWARLVARVLFGPRRADPTGGTP